MPRGAQVLVDTRLVAADITVIKVAIKRAITMSEGEARR
jgi:hypothetical protein